jgi:hypothetical protein
MTRTWALTAAIAASIGAGLIHLVVGPEHVEEFGTLGWGFYLAAALQLGWALVVLAVLLLRGRAPLIGAGRLGKLAAAGIAINVAILLSWAFARAFGLPAGETPWVPEAIGSVDSICAALQLVVIAAMLAGRRRAGRLVQRATVMPGFVAATLALVVIAAGTGVALSASGEHGAGHDHAMSRRP